MSQSQYRRRLDGVRSPRRDVDAFILSEKAKGCARCPETSPCCLEFHHRDKETKEFTIAQARQSSIHIDRIAAEIAKCELLCRNCHAKEEAAAVRDRAKVMA